jgi:zinc protease
VRALALPLPGEFVHLRIRIPAGAVHDPDGREGLALLTARMLTAGSDGRRPLAEMLGDREVRLTQTALQDDSPLANREFIEIGATLYPHALGETLQAIAGAITAPGFAGDALARARRDLASGAEGLQHDSQWRAARAVFEALYPPTHVYGRPPEGSARSRETITIDDVRAFHRGYYRPDTAVIAVAGAIEPEAAFGQMQEAFAAWRAAPVAATSRPARPANRSGPSASRRIDIPMDQPQASIAVGLPAVSRDSADFAALSALNYLLGETGYAGRLGEALVDTGIAYAVYASVLADRGAGPVLVTTDAVRSSEAADLIVKTLEGFARKGVTESELREAQGFLLGRLLFRFESPQAATEALVEAGYFASSGEPRGSAPADPLREFARAVLDLTVADLNRAATRYYDPGRAVVVVAGR